MEYSMNILVWRRILCVGRSFGYFFFFTDDTVSSTAADGLKSTKCKKVGKNNQVESSTVTGIVKVERIMMRRNTVLCSETVGGEKVRS